jgi:hypothetical protein
MITVFSPRKTQGGGAKAGPPAAENGGRAPART